MESEAGTLDQTVVEAIVPGLDYCNHSAAANCRWILADDAQVKSRAQGLPLHV